MLNHQIAREIVKETMTRLNRNINIMDTTGTIIASGDPSRINQLHEGALEVLQTGRPLIVSPGDSSKWRGTLSGINLPIEFQGKIVGVIGITGERKEVEEFGELVKMTTEMMIKQAFLASLTEWRQRTREDVIEELIKPKPQHEFVEHRLNLLNVRLMPPFQVALVVMKERTLQNQAVIALSETIFDKERCFAGFINANKLLLLTHGISESSTKQYLHQFQTALERYELEFIIGLGGPVDRREKVSISYAEAETAIALRQAGRTLTAYCDIEAQALMQQVNHDFQARYLERVLPNLSAKTKQTLEAFFACSLNISETAMQLFIHRNTLIYRLKQVKEKTGLDPQVFQDAVRLQHAVWMHENKKLKNMNKKSTMD